jgi:uncharacterized membrane protein
MSRPTGPDPATVTRDGAALVLTREALRWATPAALVLVLGAWALRGTAAAVTAAVTGAAVLLLQFAAGWLTGAASRISPHALQAATLLGVLVRLGIYALLLLLLDDVTAIDRPVLAVVAVTLTLIVLAAEARMALRYSKLWWQPTTVAQGEPAPPARMPTWATSSAAPQGPDPDHAPPGDDQKDRL